MKRRLIALTAIPVFVVFATNSYFQCLRKDIEEEWYRRLGEDGELTLHVKEGTRIFRAEKIEGRVLRGAQIEWYDSVGKHSASGTAEKAELRFDTEHELILVSVENMSLEAYFGMKLNVESRVFEYELPEPFLRSLWNRVRQFAR
jgi:hypothetical protein